MYLRPVVATLTVLSLCVALLTFARGASAQELGTPRCDGHDPQAAAQARADGLAHYRRASGRSIRVNEMREALAAFERACAAGDSAVLEFRAYALAGLGRFVDAAESLDAFIAAHPLEAMETSVRDRVTGQRAVILAQVATLGVSVNVEGATVAVDGRAMGVTPVAVLRLPPGNPVISVTAAGYVPVTRTVQLVAGSVRTELVELRAVPAETATPRPVEPATPAEPNRVTPPSPATPGPSPTPPPSGSASLRVPAIATLSVGVALVGGAVGATMWASNRASATQSDVCTGTPPAGQMAVGCDAAQFELNAARGVQIAAFAAGGALALTGVALFVVDAVRHRGAAVRSALPACGPVIGDGTGLACGSVF